MHWFSQIIKLIRNVMIGFGMGAIATAVYLFIALRLQLPMLSTGLMLKELLGSMAFGAYCGIISLIFEWGMQKVRKDNVVSLLFWRTALNFLLMITGFWIAGKWLGWFETDLSTLFLLLGSFLFVYILIWFFSYLYQKKLAKQLNEGLKKL